MGGSHRRGLVGGLSLLLLLSACPAPTLDGKRVDCDHTRDCEERFAADRPGSLWQCIPEGLCVELPFCAEPRNTCPAQLDFDPGLGARPLPGVFEHAPLLQGDPRSIELESQDRISWTAGARLGDTLHERLDLSRGTVLAWITPEWSTAELPPGGAGLMSVAGLGVRVLPDGTLRLERRSGVPVEFTGLASGWSAGETRLLVLRWGAAYTSGTTDFVADLGAVRQRVTTSNLVDIDLPGPVQLLGVASEQQPSPARARIEGLHVYRRPLHDGSTGEGLDLGHGDELAAIQAGRDPASVTGSWDLLFALPTRQRPGRLGQEGEAYAHPLGEDLLAGHGLFSFGSGIQGFVIDAGASFLPPAERRLGLGLTLTVAQPGQGLSHGLPLQAGESFVVRALCWIREGSTGQPRLEVAADGVGIASIEGVGLSGGATADAPEVLLFTGDVPAGTGEVRLHLGVGDGIGSMGCHVIEVQKNLLINPSLERGVGDPWQPEGWQHEIDEVAVEALRETAEVHSGQSALRYLADFSGTGRGGFAHLRQTPPGQVQEGYYAAGGFFRWVGGQSPGISITNGSLFSLTRPVSEGQKFSVRVREPSDGWVHVAGVGRRWQDSTLNAHNDIVRWGAPEHMSDAELVVDDAYFLPLAAVPLELFPATVAGSHQGGFVRLDGDDRLGVPVALSARQGSVVSVYRRGPVLGTPLAGREAACTLLEVWGGTDDVLRVVQRGSDLVLEGTLGGAPQATSLEGAAPAEDAEHRLALSWERDRAWLRVDQGVVREVRLAGALEADPSLLRLGEDAAGQRDCDLLVLLPGPWSY
ncbi:MAG: hypothetical protein P1V51_02110 [Deltaproteobacteria bacterium]|nr:hypothetical protein [Deltaproteobacteria bacterium]